MVSNSIQKYNVPMQALGQSQIGGPAMQGPASDQLKQTVDNSHISKRLKASDESSYKLPLIIASWLGLNKIADVANDSFGGTMESSSLGRVGAWGDKVSDSIKSTKAGQFLVKTKNKLSAGTDWLAGKSKIAHTLKHNSTRPEWEFARFPFEGLNGFLNMDIKSLLDDFLKPIKDPLALEQYGVAKSEIDVLSKSLKALSSEDRALALQKAELKALGLDAARIEKLSANYGIDGMKRVARLGKIKKLGFTNPSDYAKYVRASYDNKNLLFDALSNADKNIRISAWRNEKVLGSKHLGTFFSNLTGRSVSVDALRNKLAVVLGKSNAKSSLGKSLQKSMGWLLEGTTGRFGGGKLIPLMMAVPLADGIISAVKAPKGEHGKTLAERIINDFSYVFSMPLAVMGMHKIGGLKYAGLDEAGVNAYRTALKEFNIKSKAGLFANKAEYNAAKKSLSKMLRADVKNPIVRLCKGIGRFINVGNETRAAYKSASKFNLNWLRGSKNFLKNCAGVPLRIALGMFVLSPLVAKVCTKFSHVLFGKPTNSILDDTAEPEMVDEQLANQLMNEIKANQNNPFAQNNHSVVHKSPTNLLNMSKNGQVYKSSEVNNTVNNTIVNKDNNDNKVLEPVRTYIPSPDGVKIVGEDTTAADQAMARADLAERKAMETLAMRW